MHISMEIDSAFKRLLETLLLAIKICKGCALASPQMLHGWASVQYHKGNNPTNSAAADAFPLLRTRQPY